jgi:hypothetical protein
MSLAYCVFEVLRLVLDTAALRRFSCPDLRGEAKLLYSGGDETFVSKSMKAIHGYQLIKLEDLSWRPSNL